MLLKGYKAARRLDEAVRRNPERFPGDFMLQLSSQEFAGGADVRSLGMSAPLTFPGDAYMPTKDVGT